MFTRQRSELRGQHRSGLARINWAYLGGIIVLISGVHHVWARVLTTAVAFGACIAPVAAMNVSPMITEIMATGARSTTRIQVINTLPQALPYEVRVFRIDFDNDGKITETPADQDFVVFPPQGVIQPGQRQLLRLQWIGGILDSSRGYYVSINQVPVALVPTEASKTRPVVDVKVVYHMKVLATVSPKGAVPIVKVVDVKPAMVDSDQPGGPPQPGIAVTVTNTGKRHAFLVGSNWTIDGKDKQGKPVHLVITSAKMGQMLGAGYLPALTGRRAFKIPTGVEFSNAPISVKFTN